MVHWPFPHDVQAIQRIDAVTSVLDIVCRTTDMGFAAVARVTEERWIACALKHDIQFGLKPCGELKVETTICREIRRSGTLVIIDHVAQDQAFCGHPTPAMYGFQSYISVPIVRADETFFGTLCAIDPRPAVLKECDLMVPKSVYCDAGRIGQLLNLLVAANALIHGSATSPILVYARSDEKAFELSVHNAGVPIPSSTLEKLFQPFFRGGAKSSRQGLELGLYIASEVALTAARSKQRLHLRRRRPSYCICHRGTATETSAMGNEDCLPINRSV